MTFFPSLPSCATSSFTASYSSSFIVYEFRILLEFWSFFARDPLVSRSPPLTTLFRDGRWVPHFFPSPLPCSPPANKPPKALLVFVSLGNSTPLSFFIGDSPYFPPPFLDPVCGSSISASSQSPRDLVFHPMFVVEPPPFPAAPSFSESSAIRDYAFFTFPSTLCLSFRGV